ncbi:MAG: LysR family transcriptional regulator, partial [Dehalococcoidia bacterium]|nr:LysR family transcriptional regulator [Dehalococcoidia bacterium]
MEIRELISFYHVARLRSVSKAAEYLEIGQPTVSTHLQKIEREFGVTLFDRIKRPIQLTSDGTIFYDLAGPIVERIAEGVETIKMQMAYPEHRGTYAIGPYPDLVLHQLAPIVKDFRTNNPRV